MKRTVFFAQFPGVPIIESEKFYHIECTREEIEFELFLLKQQPKKLEFCNNTWKLKY